MAGFGSSQKHLVTSSSEDRFSWLTARRKRFTIEIDDAMIRIEDENVIVDVEQELPAMLGC